MTNDINSTQRAREYNPLRGIKQIVIIAMILTIGVLTFIQLYPEKINNLSLKHTSIAYRLENYPFSCYIAKQHPFSGIGLRAPRTAYLKDYKLQFQHITPEHFQYQVESIRTSENIFFSMLAGLGFPITVLFIIILFQQMKNLWFTPALGYDKRYIFHPYALFLSLMLVLLNSLLYDSFLFPQVSWYFGIMLGFIPTTKKTNTKLTR
jgi:O-antigen ligase